MVSVSHRAARDAVLQRHAIEKLYDDERLVAALADLVMVQMLGWFRAGAARTSLRKRSRACGSLATASGRNFKATKRPSSVSSAFDKMRRRLRNQLRRRERIHENQDEREGWCPPGLVVNRYTTRVRPRERQTAEKPKAALEGRL
jgi:hypothetical protein